MRDFFGDILDFVIEHWFEVFVAIVLGFLMYEFFSFAHTFHMRLMNSAL